MYLYGETQTMNKLFSILFIVVILFTGCSNNCKPQKEKSDLYSSLKSISIKDTADILQKFFSPIRIDHKKTAVWKPEMDDYFNLPISEDSLCRTNIDTILEVKPYKYLIIFRTEGFRDNGNKQTCHICSPVYGIASVEKDDSVYNITNFSKNLIAAGSFGNGYDTLKVEKFGKDFSLLRFSSSYVGTSTETLTNTYFELEHYKQVFSYFTYRAVGDSTELDPEYTNIEQQLIHIPGKEFNDRDDIKLDGYITSYDTKLKKYIKKKQVEYYRSDDFGNYQRAL